MKKDIITLATQFRTAIENTPDLPVPFDTFPKGCCGDTSDLLAQWLWDNGYESRYYCGRRAPDQRTHAWLEVDDLVVDITGDQFSDFSETIYVGPLTPFHIAFHIPEVEHDMVNGFHIYDAGSVAKLEWIYKKILEHIPESDEDFHLTPDQINYIKPQQTKATTLVYVPTSPYYEPDPDKRRTSARTLKRGWEYQRAKQRVGIIISVIVPIYNVEPYLKECIDSIVNQTYRDIEIILVDDGSTDHCGQICDSYTDSRIKVFHTENHGLSAARNFGIDHSIGDFLFFIDSDDWIEPIVLERAIENIGNGDILCLDSKEAVYSGYEALVANIKGVIDNAAWNKLYKRECFESTRFPDGRIMEDVATTYKLLFHAKRVICINYNGYHHRYREGSISNTRNLVIYADNWTAFLERCQFCIPLIDTEDLELRQDLLESCALAISCAWGRRNDIESAESPVWKEMSNAAKTMFPPEYRKHFSFRIRGALFLARYNKPWSFWIANKALKLTKKYMER